MRAGGISSYAWDFGDGTVSSGVNASHVYSAGGTFNATLKVTDTNGFSASVMHPGSISKPVNHQKKCRKHKRRCKRRHKRGH